MSSIKLISILIPAYNVEKYITRCLNSIIGQINQECEVIVVNDHSTDNTEKFIDQIILQNDLLDIIKINNPINLGLANSRKIALEQSRGDYIFNVDGDDDLEEGVLLQILELIKNKNIDLIYFDYNLVWEKGKKRKAVKIFDSAEQYLVSTLSAKSESSVCNKIIKRSLYFENNIFPFQNLNYGEDFGVTSRILYFSKDIYYFPMVCYNYNQTNVNSYTKNGSLKVILDLESIFGLIKEFYNSRKEQKFIEHLNIGIARKLIQLFYSFDFSLIKDISRVFNLNYNLTNLNDFSISERIILHGLKNENYVLLLICKKIHVLKSRLIRIVRK
jgi:glycosyltransferase involved in cell wall biosynthesis